jgi:hypothetical protein
VIINRKAWHYKVYEFTYRHDLPPRQTNLCQYVRRVVLMGPLMGVAAAFLLAMMSILVVFHYLLPPFFGWRPRQWSKPFSVFDTNGMVKYQGLKLGSSYNAFQLYPWHIILATLVVGAHAAIYHFEGGHPLLVEGEILGIILFLLALVVGSVVYSESDTGRLISQYLAAKKQKVCPVVEFKNEEPKP